VLPTRVSTATEFSPHTHARSRTYHQDGGHADEHKDEGAAAAQLSPSKHPRDDDANITSSAKRSRKSSFESSSPDSIEWTCHKCEAVNKGAGQCRCTCGYWKTRELQSLKSRVGAITSTERKGYVSRDSLDSLS
jgi:hypothetical protein